MERELLLLGLLQEEGRHGYELHDFIEKYMQSCVELKKPTAYYLLEKLAKGGYVTETVEQSGNRPARRVYKLTKEGEDHFQLLLRENLRQYIPVRFANLVGLAFLDNIVPAEAIPLLRQRRESMAILLADAETAPAHLGAFQLLIDHQVAHLRAELDWLDAVIDHLNQNTHS